MKTRNSLLLFVLLFLANYGLAQTQSFPFKINLKEFTNETKMPTTPRTTVLSDGIVLNKKKYFMQIKEPDVSKIAPMPQARIDTTIHYHIAIVGEVKERKK